MIAAAFDSAARFVWTRNRKVIIGSVLVYFAIFLAYQFFTPQQMRGYLPQSMAILRLAPFFLPVIMLISTVNVATLQLGGREGNFPRLFFTLPLEAHEMVLPFVVYAVASTAALWTAGFLISDARVLMFGPPGTPIEAEKLAYWVPCMSTSLLVWFQALVWTPVPRGWMRVWLIVGVLLAHTIVMVMLLGGTLTQPQVVTGSLLQIPLAFLVAARGVKRDRSGVARAAATTLTAGGPDERAAKRYAKAAKSRSLRLFPSGFDAQLWFERHIHRWNGIGVYALPVFGLVLFILAEFVGTPKKSPETFAVLARVVLSLFFWITFVIGMVAGFLFASFRAVTRWQVKEAFAMPSYFAALPVSTGDFVWAKFIAMTTRVLWLGSLSLLACGWIAWRAGILDPNTGPILALRQQHGDFTALTMLAMPVLAFFLFLLSATASLLALSLGGAAWHWMNRVNAGRYVIAAIAAVLVSGYWGLHHAPPPGLPEALQILAAMKIASLVVLVLHVGRTGLLSWNRLATILAVWLATFGAMLTATLLFLPEGTISSLTLVALLVLLAPVQGTVAAPLALQLNRTR
jgi:hypothetical protein